MKHGKRGGENPEGYSRGTERETGKVWVGKRWKLKAMSKRLEEIYRERKNREKERVCVCVSMNNTNQTKWIKKNPKEEKNKSNSLIEKVCSRSHLSAIVEEKRVIMMIGYGLQ